MHPNEILRLDLIRKGQFGAYMDDIAAGVEATIRRQVSNATDIPPEAVVLDKTDLSEAVERVREAFSNAVFDVMQAAKVVQAARDVS